MKNKLALILSLLLLTACTAAAQVDKAAESGGLNSNRGICAVTTDNGMLITWRSFAADPESTAFELYRSGSLVYVSNPGDPTCYLDAQGSATTSRLTQASILVRIGGFRKGRYNIAPHY